ncbi:hypothetical protein [Belnapia rosea]|uniref:Uncharacterized protein n=1 Tax=Belnapia rosea TaxID=938405 RepID=A0A1G6WR88_9PROT|nr:hypothetical protein [Belnapia rosea]SDB68414.1 hypothetical protein SAMN02927895_03225 [Belnapia rosea]SDD67555.1 hypothetical protein SAMN04487779_101111 [Belnapia rosea]
MTPTAEILPFPEKPEDRLRRALRALDAALAEQGVAMAGLRRELGTLSGAVQGLDRSMQAYAHTLAETQEAALSAHAEARRLEATADAMLIVARG